MTIGDVVKVNFVLFFIGKISWSSMPNKKKNSKQHKIKCARLEYCKSVVIGKEQELAKKDQIRKMQERDLTERCRLS